jgi:hypothetical protein
MYPEATRSVQARLAADIRDALRLIPSSTQVATAGLFLTIVVVIAQTAGQLIDYHFFHLKLRMLDSDHHASVFGALSIFAEAGAAITIGLRAVSGRRLPWLLAAAVVGMLTLPRALMRYEAVFERYDVAFLMAPLAVVFVVMCALTFRDPRGVRFLVWGSLVLLACSFALHAFGPQADAAGRTAYLGTYAWVYQGTGMLKHGLELAGWMLLATGMIAAVSPLTDAGLGIRRRGGHEQSPDPLARA